MATETRAIRGGQLKDRQSAKIAKDVLFWLAILLVVGIVLIPFYWLIITSVKIAREAMSDPIVFFPSIFTFENYKMVFEIAGIRQLIVNTVVISVGATFFATVIGSMMAYALTKSRLPGNLNTYFALWVLVTRMYPPITTAIPYFLLLRSLRLLDTQAGMILTYVGVLLPFVVWMMYGFFKEIPIELEHAALVDGCGMWQRFWVITLPLAGPALVATTILSFITAWNEFLFALILSAVRSKTVPVALAAFLNEKGLEWGPMTALGTIHVIPVLILALVAQRYLVSGLTFGAVKE